MQEFEEPSSGAALLAAAQAQGGNLSPLDCYAALMLLGDVFPAEWPPAAGAAVTAAATRAGAFPPPTQMARRRALATSVRVGRESACRVCRGHFLWCPVCCWWWSVQSDRSQSRTANLARRCLSASQRAQSAACVAPRCWQGALIQSLLAPNLARPACLFRTPVCVRAGSSSRALRRSGVWWGLAATPRRA